MKIREIVPLLLTLLLTGLLTAPSAFAQTPGQPSNQELNDQMWEAVRKGDAEAVKALLDKGADVNAKFRYGTTALFKAAEKGNTEVVKLLIERGADVTVKDTFYGATAMTWALEHDHVEVVRALLEKDGSSINNVLMTGVRKGKVNFVEMALAKGGTKPETLTAALATALNDKDKAAIAEMLKKAGAVPPPEIDAATLESYAGKYKNEQGLEFIVKVTDGKLFAAPVGQQPIALSAIDKVSFRPTAFDGIVVTMQIEGGKATGFNLKQGATATLFKRVEETKQP